MPIFTINALVIFLVFVVLFSSIRLWSAAIRIWKVGQPLLPCPAPLAPWGLVDLGLTLLIWLSVSVVTGVVGASIIGLRGDVSLDTLDPAKQVPVLWLFGISTLTTVVLSIGILVVRHRATLAELGWDGSQVANDLSLGLKAFVMLAPLVYGIQLLITQFFESSHPLVEMLKVSRNIPLLLAAGFTAVVVAPLAEEFLFRVLLQGWLERLFGANETTARIIHGGRSPATSADLPPPGEVLHEPQSAELSAVAAPEAGLGNEETAGVVEATIVEGSAESAESQLSAIPLDAAEGPRTYLPVIFSSLVFALAHWSHGPDPIPLFVFALGLGYLYQRTNRILPSVVLHFLLNACSLAALFLGEPT